MNILSDIREGMRVVDPSGEEIGTVDFVHLSDENPSTPQAETITPGTDGGRTRDSLFDFIANAFRADELPEALQSRLLREGFVRIDADGLFAAERYILPEQIHSVSDGQVVLNVGRDELIRR